MDDYITKETAVKIVNTPGYNIHDINFALKTVPALRIIHCRDCRYWSTGIAYETSGYCTHDEPHQIRKADFFCGNGKERE